MSYEAELMGAAAGCMTTFCWLPQAIRILVTRNTRAISLLSQTIFTAGCFLWAIYGFIERKPSIVAFNAVTCILSAGITYLKMRLG